MSSFGSYQIHKYSPWHIFSTRGFIVVDIDALELEFRGTNIGSSGVNAMLIRDDLPKLPRTIKIIPKNIAKGQSLFLPWHQSDFHIVLLGYEQFLSFFN